MAKIYHYTKLSTAIEFILPSMSLRTNFLNKMNGPKENQKWSFGGINVPYETLYSDINIDIDSDKDYFGSMYKFGEELKSKIQATCFVYSDTYKQALMRKDGSLIQLAQVAKADWMKACTAARIPDMFTQNDMDAILDVKTRWDRKQYGKSYHPIL